MPSRPLSSSSASESAPSSGIAPVKLGRSPRASSPPSPPPPQGREDGGEFPFEGPGGGLRLAAPDEPSPPVVRSALALVVVLVVVLSGCGGGGTGEEPGAPSGTTSPETTPTGASDTQTVPLTFTLDDGALATGAEGVQVRRLQEALLVLGFDTGAIDGVFGPGTRRAVIEFQRENRLEADGIVGQQTANAINAALERRTTSDG